ncbi:hypothetical protein EDC04DRAFT_2607655 [Pisolithus marmoratus]|nr:hypothetical protein EDC04DRAFT_2607655 [Pisolithus marmoratus]
MCLESLQVQPSPIGHITMALALLGQGDAVGALCTFDLAFHDCELHNIRFLLLLKSILMFKCRNQEEAITHVEDLAMNNDKGDDTTYLYTQAHALNDADVLGVMCMKKGTYSHGIQLIEHKIFGWSFNGLDIAAQQCLCETLYAEEHTSEALEVLVNIIRTSNKVHGSNTTADWIADFTQKCTTRLEDVGDETFGFAKHNGESTQYSAVLPLSPLSPSSLFIRQSRAWAAKGLWEDALQDANAICMAVKVDPSYPWGYEAKHVAIYGAK